MVTMYDVAKRAGISKATVSRVLNSHERVSEATRARVMQAIAETGYQPNMLARQLATQKTSLIGFVVTNALYNSDYFASLIYNAATFTEQYQHQLILADGKHGAADEQSAIQFLQNMRCAGIVVYPENLTELALSDLIAQSEVPIMVINRKIASYPKHCFWVDQYASAMKLMQYLLQQGHRRIAYIGGKQHSQSNRYRFAAYQDALAQQQLPPAPQSIVMSDWSLEGGYQATQRLLASGLADHSAILAANDNMAIGAMKALREAGYRIPQDIAIAGFDNLAVGAYCSPALTSVQIPIDSVINSAIATILQIHASATTTGMVGELVIRDSVSRLVVE